MKRSGFGPRRKPLSRGSWKSSPSAMTVMRRSEMKRRARPRATTIEREYMSVVAGLACIVCRNLGFGESPAEVHHVRYLAGAGQRSSNFDTLPLCPNHHRLGGYGVAYHAGPEEWERRYGTEADLLAQTKRELNIEVNQLEQSHG